MSANSSSPPLLFDSRAVALAASTGGPAALEQVFADFAAVWHSTSGRTKQAPPFFITQHISAPFAALLGRRLSALSGFDCEVAAAGGRVRGDCIYIAPEDSHLAVLRREKDDAGIFIRLMQTPPVHFCRPAADPMLQSLAGVYGENLLAVILTGMGKDGLTGCQHVAAAGGHVWVQDASSSVVWGMPGAVAASGIDCRIMPLRTMGAALAVWAAGGTEGAA